MKKHTNKPHHRHNHLIPPSSLQHPPHLFNTNHAQPLHLIFKACFSPNHSTPIRNRKVTILTPTKSQSKYSTIIMILYACTNEKYLIPISVPILPHTTPQHRIIPTLQFCVDGGRCDGVILYIGECKYILKEGFCCNWSVRCVVCVCCNFVLDVGLWMLLWF